LHIRVQRQIGHEYDGVGQLPNIHSGLDHGDSTRLSNTPCHALAHFHDRIPDIPIGLHAMSWSRPSSEMDLVRPGWHVWLGMKPSQTNQNRRRVGSSLHFRASLPAATIGANRFGAFFRDCVSIDAISGDDLTRFGVTLKKDHALGSNTILHNAVIVARFLKRHGRSGITKELPLPERITPLVKIYRHEELARFFAACSDQERALFATFLLTGFREQEVMFLRWSDVNFELRIVRVTSKPELGFYPKRWEDREIPAPICVPIPHGKPRTAHARSLQIYREARQTRSETI